VLIDSSLGYVTAAQAATMYGLVEAQRANLYTASTANIVGLRTSIAGLLRDYAFFGEAAYLAANPDVAAAVRTGALTSGWAHYDAWGRSERRALAPTGYGNFNEAGYLAANSDVANLVKSGFLSSGWQHYQTWGRNETRLLVPNGYGSFDESAYLAAYPDVAAAVHAGAFGSGLEHYLRWGKTEGRTPNPLAGTATESVREKVLAWSATYGDLDGENNTLYATTFAQVYQSLSATQRSRLTALRRSILSGKYADGTAFDYTEETSFFLYSDTVRDTSLLTPYIGDTDYLFREP
jgi:hypothetical protein